MKKLLPLFFMALFLLSGDAYAMEAESADGIPTSEAACVNEIISGIRQKKPGQNTHPKYIIPINANDIERNKRLLRRWKELDNKAAAPGISHQERVFIHYVDVQKFHPWLQIESQTLNLEGKCTCFVATLTPEQVVELWSTNEVDEEKIPNKNWREDLKEVKAILGLN